MVGQRLLSVSLGSIASALEQVVRVERRGRMPAELRDDVGSQLVRAARGEADAKAFRPGLPRRILVQMRAACRRF